MVGRIRDDKESFQQLVEVLNVIDIGNEAFAAGKIESWMIISAYLHQLLTDTSRGNIPLILRVMDDISLHPLKQNYAGKSALPGYIMASPSVKLVPTLSDLFDTGQLTIPLTKWLAQVIFINTEEVTLHEFMVSPRNQAGGVHFDSKVSKVMQLIENHLIVVINGIKIPAFRYWTASIGKYIFHQVMSDLMGRYGNLFREEKNYEEAEAYFRAALETKLEMGDLQGQSNQLRNLGMLNNEIGQYQVASQYYLDALQLSRKFNDISGIQSILTSLEVVNLNLGNEHITSNQFAQAVIAFQKALGYSRETDHKDTEVIALFDLGNTYSRMRELPKAITCFVIGVSLYIRDPQAYIGNHEMAVQAIINCHSELRNMRRGAAQFDSLLRNIFTKFVDYCVQSTGIEYDLGIVSLEAKMSEILDSLNNFDNIKKSLHKDI